MSQSLTLASEKAHFDALAAARRAIRGGDLVAAERWMKLAERHWRLWEYACAQNERWLELRRKHAAYRATKRETPALPIAGPNGYPRPTENGEA